MQESRLGIVGGIGSQVAQNFYQHVIDNTEAFCDQDHLPTVILPNNKILDKRELTLENIDKEAFAQLRSDIEMLQRCACTLIVIPCVTSCYVIDKLKKCTKVPILSIVYELEPDIQKRPRSNSDDNLLQTLARRAIEQCGYPLKEI